MTPKSKLFVINRMQTIEESDRENDKYDSDSSFTKEIISRDEESGSNKSYSSIEKDRVSKDATNRTVKNYKEQAYSPE